MDLSKVVSNRSDKIRIHFIRYLKNPTWYFVKVHGDRGAYDFVVRFLHLPPYENSACMHIDVEWAFAVDCEEVDKEKYCDFLKERIGNYILDEDDSINRFLRGSAWYEFKDISNTDKWLATYYSWLQENKIHSSPIQATLF